MINESSSSFGFDWCERRKGESSHFLIWLVGCLQWFDVSSVWERFKHFPVFSVRGVFKGGQFRHLWTLHTELQSKWLYKEITIREVLSGFYGTLVVLRYEYHSPSLRWSTDVDFYWRGLRLIDRTSNKRATTAVWFGFGFGKLWFQVAPQSNTRGLPPCLAWLEIRTAVPLEEQVNKDISE